MITTAITISLICLGIHALFMEGMILHKVGLWNQWILFFMRSKSSYYGCLAGYYKNPKPTIVTEYWKCYYFFDKFLNIIKKPLHDCLICMSSVWTIIIGHFYYGLPIELIPEVMLLVCGINVILDSFVYYLRDGRNN